MSSWTKSCAFSLVAMVSLLFAGCGGGNGGTTSVAPVTPVTTKYTVGGTVTGLKGAGLVLQDNGGDNLALTASGGFTFATSVASGGAYAVTVSTQPTAPAQLCVVASGSGTVSANVTSVQISCGAIPNHYFVAGSVYGLTGSGLVLGNNDGDTFAVTNGGFFLEVLDNADYDLQVSAQPTGQTCALSNGNGASNTLLPVQVVCSSQWTWTAGNEGAGVYGTQGTASPGNIPGRRYGAASWTDASGNLWLFSGLQQYWLSNSNEVVTPVNDLWKYTPGTTGKVGQWTWMGGNSNPLSNGASQPGVYGTQGTAASGNIPGGRQNAVSWIDSSGNLWLFGGSGFDSAGNLGDLDDLWKYTPSATGDTGEWTWMGGNNTVPVDQGTPGVYGTPGIAASDNIPGGRQNAVSWIDSSGNLWLFGGLGYDSAGNLGDLNDLWKYTPSTRGDAGEWTFMSGKSMIFGQEVYRAQGIAAPDNTPGARLSAVSWIDASGNLWLFGGVLAGPATSNGEDLNDLWKYTPSTTGNTGEWTWMGGSGTVQSGSSGQTGVYGTLGVAAPGNIPAGRDSAVSWIDASGNLWLFGGEGEDSTGNNGPFNDLWKYTPSATGDTGEWTWIAGSNLTNQPGVQDAGTPSDNVPAGLTDAIGWADSSGDFWLFGGSETNDLWEYKP